VDARQLPDHGTAHFLHHGAALGQAGVRLAGYYAARQIAGILGTGFGVGEYWNAKTCDQDSE
jgi:hypothetical protein